MKNNDEIITIGKTDPLVSIYRMFKKQWWANELLSLQRVMCIDI